MSTAKCGETAIQQVASEWFGLLRTMGRSARTVSTYDAATKNLGGSLAKRGRSDPKEVRAEDIAAWRQSLVHGGCQPATVNQFLRTAHGLFGWLVKSGRIFSDPTADIESCNVPARLGTCPTENEMRRLLDSVRGRDAIARRDRAILELAYATGARLEEMVRLDLPSIDLGGSVVRLFGKGARERVVPLTAKAVRAIETYTTRARPHLLTAGDSESALFISTRGGGRLRSAGVAAVVQSRAQRAGLKITPHDIRRAVATHLFRGGAAVVYIKELLGHQTYSHLHRYLQLYPAQVIAEVRRSKPGRR